MALSTQMKMLRAVREILLGDGRNALPQGNVPKPDFPRNAAPSQPLPRSTPEEQGQSSDVLEQFYREIAEAPDAFAHALLLVKKGHVISEGYFSPFRPEVWHVVHSLSKSFTGAAVGLAIDEGLFGLDDRIVDIFPEKAGFFPSKRMRSVTVRHLLTMSSGITYNEISEAVDTDWLKGIFSSSVAFEPGSQFTYNSMNSYLLAAIVHKTSGENLMEYLRPRLFDPMGFGPVAWETCPSGTEKGGWGMYLCIEDMAKFGQLYLQKGMWMVEGALRQLLPESWIEESTQVHITNEDGEGYGYQIWIDEATGNYTMSGMFGQYIAMVPAQQLVVAMTAGNAQLFTDSSAYTLMKRYLFDAAPGTAPLPPAPSALFRLRHTLALLRFHQAAPQAARVPASRLPVAGRSREWSRRRLPAPAAFPLEAEAFCGTTWRFRRNRGGILPVIVQATDNNFTSGVKAIYLQRSQEHLELFWEEGRGTLCLPMGFDKPMERLIGIGKETFLVACSARIRHNENEEAMLLVDVCFLEHSSYRTLKLCRQGNNLLLLMDEQPQFAVGIETVARQDAATTGQAESGQSLSQRLMDNDFVNYRIAQICTPRLVGVPVQPEDPLPEDDGLDDE